MPLSTHGTDRLCVYRPAYKRVSSFLFSMGLTVPYIRFRRWRRVESTHTRRLRCKKAVGGCLFPLFRTVRACVTEPRCCCTGHTYSTPHVVHLIFFGRSCPPMMFVVVFDTRCPAHMASSMQGIVVGSAKLFSSRSSHATGNKYLLLTTLLPCERSQSQGF